MKALALEMLVLSKMFVMDTWDRGKDFVTKVLFLCLVVPALRVKARDLGTMTLNSDSAVNCPDFEIQSAAAESVRSIDA